MYIHIKSSNHRLSLHRLTSCTLLYSSSLLLACCTPPAYRYTPASYLLSLGILLTYIDAARTRTYRKHIMWSLSSQSIGVLAGPTENTCHVILSTLVWHHWACASSTDIKKTLLLNLWPYVCCGLCVAMDLHVTVLCEILLAWPEVTCT
jgi:hypothetical protein